MADNSDIKTIKQRVAALKDLAKTQKGLTAEKQKELTLLRQELKDVRTLGKQADKRLKKLGDRERLEKILHKNLKDETTFGKELHDIAKTQLDLQKKAVQGQLTAVDVSTQLTEIAKVEAEVIRLNEIGHTAIAEKLEEQAKYMKKGLVAMESMNEAIEYEDELRKGIDENLGGMVGKFEGMKEQAGKMGGMLKTAGGAMMLVAAAAAMALKFMFDIMKAGMELQKELGLSVRETFKLQATLMAASWEMKGLGISSDEVKQTAMGLVNEFGSFENVTKDTLVTMSKMNTEFGIAGTTSAALLGVMESVSGSSREALMSQMESTAELARAAGVAPGQIMEDVASDTEFFSKYAKDGGANVMEAAIQAKKLGLNMSTVSAMADSLLDFETSIESQMEASMMLGRSINTDVARRLALEGDLVGMQKEVMKQVGNEAEFNAMNTLQRQSLAKAFGLSVNDLGKMVRDQEVLNNMTAEERAAREKQAALLEKSKKHMLDLVARVKEIGMMLFTSLLPAFKLIGAAVVLISIVLKPFIEGVRIILPILLAIGAALGVMVIIWGIMNAQLVIASILSWATAAPWIAIPLLVIGLIGLVSLLLKKFGFFTILNDYLVKPIKEAWARFVEFAGGMDRIKKIVGIALAIMFAPLLIIPLIIWGVVKAFKMLANKVGGVGNLIKIALKMAFWPIFLAIGWIKLLMAGAKKLGSFFSGLFGGGGDAPAAASPAVSMATGGVVTKPTTATLGDAGPEAAVPLGDKFDLSETNSKFDVLIAQNKTLMDKLTKKVTEIAVAG